MAGRLETEQLVGLRVMLDEATRYARRARRYQRGTAVVLLDAVIERATVLVLVTNGQTIKQTDKLDDLISRAVEVLEGRWRPSTLPDVRLLRRARNAAQHEGLAPDSEQMPGWVAAVDAYAATIIDAQFGVDLHRVVLADAINDEELRGSFATGADALSSGNLTSAMRAFNATFTSASRRWGRLHTPGAFRTVSHRDPLKATHDRLDMLSREVQVVAIAPDAAEAHWYLQLRQDHYEFLDRDEVERAQGFVFSWVTSYESAAATWVENRRLRSAVARRRVAMNGQRPYIHDATVTMGFGGPELRVELAGVPAGDEYDAWARLLSDMLRTGAGNGRHWQLAPDGIATTGSVSQVDVAQCVREVRDALNGLDERRAAIDAARAQREASLEATRSGYRDELNGLAEEVPAWVTGVERGEGDTVQLELGPDVAHLGQRGFGRVDRGITDLIRANPAVEQCYWDSEGGCTLEPALSPAMLVEVLHAVDGDVQRLIAADEDERATAATKARELTDAARAALTAT